MFKIRTKHLHSIIIIRRILYNAICNDLLKKKNNTLNNKYFHSIFLDDSVQHKLVYKRRPRQPVEKLAQKCRNGGLQFNKTKSFDRRQHQSYLPGLHRQTSNFIHCLNSVPIFSSICLIL